MPDGTAAELRIYCICGQKMKVSESMFGLPGKCVACRQKIRVPTLDEIPPDASDIYLKDYPQFLRKTQIVQIAGASQPAAGPPSAVEEPDVELGEKPEAASVAILDILEPLRVVCSLEHKLQRQLDGYSEGGPSAPGEDRSTLLGYLDRVRNARAELDEQLRQRLMEVAIELSSTQEKILQTRLSARVGEVEFAAYRNMVDTLRRRRDDLERLHQNLRGWLAVTDPHMAGGYTNVSLESMPGEGFNLILPAAPADSRPLFEHHLDGLRDALARRERADLRLRETERLQGEGSMPALVLADCRADCEAEKRRAEAEVSFRRKAMDQLGGDFAADVQTTQSCLDRLRKRFEGGQVDRSRFRTVERDMNRAQQDYARLHSLVARALIASTAQDVPRLTDSLMRQMTGSRKKWTVGGTVDSWVAWASALLLGLCVFLPVLDKLSPIQAYQNMAFQGRALQGLMALPIAIGILATLAGALPGRAARGVLLSLLWLVFTLVGVTLLHESTYSLLPIAARFRQGGPWMLRPGIVVLQIGSVGILLAACLALLPLKRARWVLPPITAIGAIAVVGIVTDLGGQFLPRPEVSTTWNEKREGERLTYDAAVSVKNQGGRTLLLGTMQTSARNAFRYSLEHQVSATYWKEVGVLGPNEVRSIRPGQEAAFRYNLAPGNYRVRIKSNLSEEDMLAPFILPLPAEEPPPAAPVAVGPLPARQAPTPAPTAQGAAPAEQEPEPQESAVQAAPTPHGVVVELRGVVRSENRVPRFAIVLYLSNEPPKNLDVTIGDVVHGDWKVAEFNPDRQTVTLATPDRVLILSRGQQVAIE